MRQLEYLLSYFAIAVREAFNYAWADKHLAKELKERQESLWQYSGGITEDYKYNCSLSEAIHNPKFYTKVQVK